MATMAEKYRSRILVKRAQMQALHNKYEKAMIAGDREIRRLIGEYRTKQASYRKVIAGLKALKEGK